jgi:hypothetical protein
MKLAAVRKNCTYIHAIASSGAKRRKYVRGQLPFSLDESGVLFLLVISF